LSRLKDVDSPVPDSFVFAYTRQKEMANLS